MFAAVTGISACASVEPVDVMRRPLAASGDPARGREIFVSREAGHCVLCHAVPGVAVAGDIGPPLAGVGARLDAGQLRLRVADISRLNPDATMPSFHRVEGLKRVAARYAGQPVLTAQQVEDVVAYLGTLK